MSQNPLAAIGAALLGAAIQDAVKAANKKALDEIFVFVDPVDSPLTFSIRTQGDDGPDVLRGIILTLAALEKRLPPAKDQAA
jgi:hypothetical protein